MELEWVENPHPDLHARALPLHHLSAPGLTEPCLRCDCACSAHCDLENGEALMCRICVFLLHRVSSNFRSAFSLRNLSATHSSSGYQVTLKRQVTIILFPAWPIRTFNLIIPLFPAWPIRTLRLCPTELLTFHGILVNVQNYNCSLKLNVNFSGSGSHSVS